MSESGPHIVAGGPFTVYAPADMDVEQVRAELAKKTGFGIHFRFRLGPSERKSPTTVNLPCEPVDEDHLIGKFSGPIPCDGETVVYAGNFKEPLAATG